jgi:hypothetical protein
MNNNLLNNSIEELEIQLNFLYQELDTAQQDLYLFNKIALDSGEQNWVKDQENFIQYLDNKIQGLLIQLSNEMKNESDLYALENQTYEG